MAKSELTPLVVDQAMRVLRRVYLPRITSCLEILSPSQIWYRPNEASNSVGNLVLHLTGNVRQWIISGLGGAPDIRERDIEFSERGPIPQKVLARRLHQIVEEACDVLRRLPPEELARVHTIQRFRVTGSEAAFHVAEHFSHHAGQIILLTKILTAQNPDFTHLPGEKRKKARRLRAL
jgi:uncharacterized damage-inducible protein DinB